jgi:hypothetical protein
MSRVLSAIRIWLLAKLQRKANKITIQRQFRFVLPNGKVEEAGK